MNILFWNVYRSDNINDLLAELIIENDSDIIALAEYEDDINKLLVLINNSNSIYYIYPMLACKRIQIISKFRPKNFNIGPEDSYFRIWRFPFYDFVLINIAFVHFPIVRVQESDKMEIAKNIREEIEKFEKDTQCNNSLIIGDFNMNPFDKPVYSAGGLHAISDSYQAKKLSRSVRTKDRYYFYNPMWNLLGDRISPAGSYYYSDSILDCLFWHIVDQVCIRPSLIDEFDMESLKIITTIGGNSILKNNIPDKNISDHLPLSFNLKEK